MTKQTELANNAAIVLTALGTSSMTQAELAIAANISRARISEALTHLRSVNRVHVSEWRLSGAVPVSAFKAGPGIDAPPKSEQDRAQLCSEILAHLRTGDMTVPDLLLAIPRTNKIMLRLSLRLLYKTHQAHITSYTKNYGGAKPIWRVGPGHKIARSKENKPGRKLPPVIIPPPDPVLAAFFGR